MAGRREILYASNILYAPDIPRYRIGLSVRVDTLTLVTHTPRRSVQWRKATWIRDASRVALPISSVQLTTRKETE